jgi:ribonuclease III
MMDISELEKNIGYAFANPLLCQQALRHRSFVNEQAESTLADNERLEFLGDAVLSLCISHLLITYYPELDEGSLSKSRAGLVNDQRLADRSHAFSLGTFILLGKGEEQTHGRRKDSILAGAFEALLGAIYLDGGLPAAMTVVNRFFHQDLKSLDRIDISRDYKSSLQEYSQAAYKISPVYELIESLGPDHQKIFHYSVTVGNIVTEGFGSSKQAAQQVAAQKALEEIQSSTGHE